MHRFTLKSGCSRECEEKKRKAKLKALKERKQLLEEWLRDTNEEINNLENKK